MNYLKRHDLEKGFENVLKETLKKIQEVHDTHKKDIVFPGGIRLSSKNPLHTLIVGLYDILKPVIKIVRKEFPQFFALLDWCEEVVHLILHP